MTTNNNYIIPAFHFRVSFTGLRVATEADTMFESVSGIQGTLQHGITDPGNRNENATTIFQPLVLKRAVVLPRNSGLLQWVVSCLNNPVYEPLPQVLVEVLNEEHQPLIIIRLKEVSFKNWALGELHAQQSGLLME
jgi:phage tail-like protein